MRGANGLAELGKRLHQHTTSSAELMRAARPPMPGALVDRDADNWLPLLTIAEVAEGEWPALARAAAIAFQSGTRDRPASSGEMLLSDIRDLFDEKRVEAIFSESIVEELKKLEHRPWADGGGSDQPITKNALARLLRHYGIKPDDVRIGREAKKGYKEVWFEETWRRYLGEKKTGKATADSQRY